MPEPDGTDSCSEQIAKLYFKSDFEKSVQLQGFNSLLNRREELVQMIGKMEKEKDTIDQKIKLEMQDAAYATTEDYRIAWTTNESRRLDSKRFKEEHPKLYDSYCKTINSRRFTVNHAA